TGGKVGQVAAEKELPLVEVPSRLQPRAAMGYLSVPLAACLESLGLVEDVAGDVEETAAVLKGLSALYGPENPAAGNPAKQLAAQLKDKIPVIYGCELTTVAANRWKCQINENAKALAFYNEFPELNHNEIVGWEKPEALVGEFKVIYLSDGGNHPQNDRRMQITADLLPAGAAGIYNHPTTGESRLARLFSGIYLGDYVSLYLAVLGGVDPSPVARIEDLKKRLG
ncbi:MAG: bifunctional phosphoglucose/phosphomannose isomerase, partial [Actinomycetota bacterium]